jgi:hypothetical protein
VKVSLKQEAAEWYRHFFPAPRLEPETSEILPKKRDKGEYEQEMKPETRRRLEEYFEPHNRRLYDFIGTNFGW